MTEGGLEFRGRVQVSDIELRVRSIYMMCKAMDRMR